jgi:hypothetical protein
MQQTYKSIIFGNVGQGIEKNVRHTDQRDCQQGFGLGALSNQTLKFESKHESMLPKLPWFIVEHTEDRRSIA